MIVASERASEHVGVSRDEMKRKDIERKRKAAEERDNDALQGPFAFFACVVVHIVSCTPRYTYPPSSGETSSSEILKYWGGGG